MDTYITKIRVKHGEENETKLGKNLYHYTSLPSFYGIIQNKELWLGNTETMNDSKELLEFSQRLETAVCEDFPQKTQKTDPLWSKIRTEISKSYPYVMCFSSSLDDAAQWERYAANATGVCIVFNTNTLTQLFHAHSCFLGKVFYGGDIRQHEHYKIVSDYLSNGDWGNFSSEEGWISNLVATASCHKHKSFSAENETRLIMLSEPISSRDDGLMRIEYVPLSNKIRKVLKVRLDLLCRNADIPIADLFDSIMLAPRSNQAINILKDFLKENGFSKLAQNIHESDCPLR